MKLYEFIFRELHGNISYFGNFMGTFSVTGELLELCCIGLLSFPLRCGRKRSWVRGKRW
jgi:hypothetical protein